MVYQSFFHAFILSRFCQAAFEIGLQGSHYSCSLFWRFWALHLGTACLSLYTDGQASFKINDQRVGLGVHRKKGAFLTGFRGHLIQCI